MWALNFVQIGFVPTVSDVLYTKKCGLGQSRQVWPVDYTDNNVSAQCMSHTMDCAFFTSTYLDTQRLSPVHGLSRDKCGQWYSLTTTCLPSKACCLPCMGSVEIVTDNNVWELLDAAMLL